MNEPIKVDLETAIGTLHVGRAYIEARRGSITTNFTYDHTFLALPESYAIDPHLPITGGSHAVRGLPGAFADASPDRWGRHIISKRLQGLARRDAVSPRTLTDRDFLLGVSDLSRQGALRFRIGDGPHLSEGTDVPKLVQLPELRQAARDVERNPDPGAEHSTGIDGAVTRDDAMTALMGVSDFFVDREQRDAIAESVAQSVRTWRAAADTCGIPRSDTELFAPLLDTLPAGLAT